MFPPRAFHFPDFSSTTTRRPFCAARQAQATPAMPAPATATSQSIVSRISASGTASGVSFQFPQRGSMFGMPFPPFHMLICLLVLYPFPGGMATGAVRRGGETRRPGKKGFTNPDSVL